MKYGYDGEDEFAPLSGWHIFLLRVLFMIPVIGWVYLIVYSFSRANYNRRAVARSSCWLLLVILLIAGGYYFINVRDHETGRNRIPVANEEIVLPTEAVSTPAPTVRPVFTRMPVEGDMTEETETENAAQLPEMEETMPDAAGAVTAQADEETVEGADAEETGETETETEEAPEATVEPTPEPTPTAEPVIIGRDSDAEIVKHVQQMLIALGISRKGSDDGIYGKATTMAVKQFQINVNRDKGTYVLREDGQCDGQTLSMMEEYTAALPETTGDDA